MERIRWRVSTAQKALKTLKELSGLKDPNLIKRDAAIQRFEYTFEAIWKTAQNYLEEKEGLSIASPKGCIRASREIGLLTEPQTSLALQMADDRNMTSHTYNEIIAKRIYRNLKGYAALMENWLGAIRVSMSSSSFTKGSSRRKDPT